MKNLLQLSTKNFARTFFVITMLMTISSVAVAQPTFTGGSPQAFAVCQNSGANSINSLLSVSDPATGSTETWSTASAPSHGTVVSTYSVTSTGGTLTPSGLSYTPTAGYTGTDAFTIRVTNGTITASTVINVTVTATPAAIAGTFSVCTGATASLTDGTLGGTWSSATGSVATIGTTGTITGIAAGTSVISYTKSGCSVTATVTDKDIPVAIVGTPSVCVGATITLTDATANGTWSSGTTAHATIGATGSVTGVAQGTTTITYATGCGTAATYTVNAVAAPVAIAGVASVCAAASTTLTDASTGGTWTSSNALIATNNAGAFTGVAAGSITATYTTGCGSPATFALTVKPPPAAVSGMTALCTGSTITMTDPTAGGAWSSSNSSIATVDPVSGIVTGLAAGSISIIYSNGCNPTALKAITVTSGGPAAITGTAAICVGATTTLADGTTGGTWSSSNTAIATISSTGVVTGLTQGVVIINYTIGCGSDARYTITVKGAPAAITGASSVCVGSTITLSETAIGGTWSTSAGYATVVASTGVVTGAVAGAVNIIYTNGCGTAATDPITVIAAPAAITGTTVVCTGADVILADATAGGTWTTGNPAVATNSGSQINGVAAGTVAVTYSTGCGTPATTTVTVRTSPTAITGPVTVCKGSAITLADTTTGGTWSSSVTSRATVVSSTGVVTGVSAGAVNMTYNNGCGTATYAITVIAAPAAITGTTIVCAGADVILADATAGGTWSTSNAAVATNNAGDVTGVAPGTVTVTYNTGCGTAATTLVTVKGAPANITGALTVCVGSTITLTDTSAGGTWSSSITGRATVVSTTGVVTGVSAGAVNITYNNGCGTATYAITVIAAPAAITGTASTCQGTDAILADATAGGVWSTGNAAIATNSLNTITGVSAGTVTVTYSTGCGSDATTIFTVKGIPSPISGATTVCIGSTITLTDTTSGGTWSSSNTGRATVISSTGVVTGVSAGALNIIYTTVCGTTATYAITSLASPGAISGATSLYIGSSVSLSDAAAAGTWISGNTSVATIGATGIVTGISSGSSIVTYTTGCGSNATATVTVAVGPAPESGPATVCVGSTIALSDVTPGGTWSSSNTGRATVISSTGVVTGVAAGVVSINYTTSGGTATNAITVVAAPAAITGVTTVCAGADVILADATAGGTWSTGNAAVATNNAGDVTGIAPGTVTVTYNTGCGSAATALVTVKGAPTTINGAATVCVGSTITLTDTMAGGTWTSSSTGRATVISTTGVVTGVSAGAVNMTYNNGCGTATDAITVVAAPAAITGTTNTCQGTGVILADATAGGVWSTSNAAIATNSLGNINGISAGTVIVTYSTGCGTDATAAFTVKGIPSVISGPATVCVGSTITLTDSTTGGTWSSSNTGRATVISTTGVVTGVGAGAVNIVYTTGCGTAATYAITTIATPAAITGTTNVCQGAGLILADATAGGTWSTSNPTIATINSGGNISGISAGTVTVTYNNGCTAGATTLFTVKGIPSVITGAINVCTGATITLSDSTSGGTWSSTNTGRATVISTTGVVTGVAAGTLNMTYTTGCGTAATYGITVLATPAAITGTTNVCVGANVILADATAGGTWSTGNPSIASNSGGVITGVSAGTVTVTYSNGCTAGATTVVTVKAGPSAITGTATVCATAAVTLSDSVSFGTWSSSSTARATVSTSTGIVTGISAGAVTITYTNGCGIAATYPMTVKALPAAITGTMTECVGATTTLSDVTAGGAWSSASISIASVNATGAVKGIAAGTTNILYTVSGCPVSALFTIKAAPLPITGTTVFCNTGSTTLSDATTSGIWSSSNASVASVNAATGVVTGIAAGTSIISYSTGCGISSTVTVTAEGNPGAISGTATFCTGSTSNFTDGITGGVWSCSNTAIATINPTTGIASGLSAGSATISYALTNTCGTNVVTYGVTVATPGTWLGTVSANWSDAGNWVCGIIPDSTINVVIPSGTTYTLTVNANNFAKNFTIASGAGININSGETIGIKGGLTNNGIISGDGVVAINAASAQVLSGTGYVSNLQVNNAAGVSVNPGDTVKVSGNLQLTLGTLTTNNGIEITSCSTGSGRIGTITGGTISGNVTIQQYIQGDRRAYRFMSHPFVASIPLSQLTQYIDITGSLGSTNGFTTTTSNAPSAYMYNTLTANSAMGVDPGWSAFTSTNGTGANAFGQFEGIRVFVRGIKGQGLDGVPYSPSPVTINTYGVVNRGNITIAMKKGSGANADYNLLGNPYPSPVDIGTVIYNAQTAGQVTGGAYYVWNPYLSTGGQYETRPIDGSAYNLETNGAYEVRAASNGAVLNFAETNKAASINTILLKTTNEYLTLNVYDTTYHKWDGMYIKFNDGASEHEDALYDGRKPVSPASLNFYSWSADNTKLSLDARPYSEGKVIPLGIKSDYAQEFIIKADNVALPSGGQVYLHDKYLGKYTLLSQGTEYRFAITADSLSQGDKRFELGMGTEEVATIPAAAAKMGFDVNMMPNPATDEVTVSYTTTNKGNVSVRIMNAAGVTEIEQNLGAQQSGSTKIGLDKLASGIYIVELTSGNQKMVQRLVKE